MERVAQMVFRHGLSQLRRRTPGFQARRAAARGIRGWQLWSLPPRLRGLVFVVIGAYLAWAAVLAPGFAPTAGDLGLACALLACGVATVALARRDSETCGAVKDVYAVWELPVLIHLPLMYALAVPAAADGADALAGPAGRLVPAGRSRPRRPGWGTAARPACSAR